MSQHLAGVAAALGVAAMATGYYFAKSTCRLPAATLATVRAELERPSHGPTTTFKSVPCSPRSQDRPEPDPQGLSLHKQPVPPPAPLCKQLRRCDEGDEEPPLDAAREESKQRMSLSLDPHAMGLVTTDGQLLRCGGVPSSWAPWRLDPAQLQPCLGPDGKPISLGRGSCGEVYLAMHGGVNPVAVKRMRTDGDMAGAVREVALLKALCNRNIVQFQGACVDGDALLLVREFCEGGNLHKAIGKGTICWRRMGGQIAMDVARGLHFLHSNRVLHLDLNSLNILLTRHGEAKIGDVGLARIRSAKTTSLHTAELQNAVGPMTGVAAWAAPELLVGEPHRCNEKADMFSFGVVLWEVATGETPVRGSMRKVRVPEECPQEVAQLITDCMHSEPLRRPSALDAHEVLRATWKATCRAASAATGGDRSVVKRISKSFDSAKNEGAKPTGPASRRTTIPAACAAVAQVFQNAPARIAPITEHKLRLGAGHMIPSSQGKIKSVDCLRRSASMSQLQQPAECDGG